MTKVFLFGDSIARGKNDYQNGGWVKIVEKAFNRKYKDNVFYDLTISGEKTSTLLEHIEDDVKRRLKADDKNNIIIIGCGINDYLFNIFEESLFISRNIGLILDRTIFKDFTFIILPLLNFDSDKIKPFHNFKVRIADINNNFMLILINSKPILRLYSDINLNDLHCDGMHLSKEGHKKYAKILVEELRKRTIL